MGTRRVAGRSLLQPFHGVCFFTCHASSETTAVPRSTCEADSEIAADLDANPPPTPVDENLRRDDLRLSPFAEGDCRVTVSSRFQNHATSAFGL